MPKILIVAATAFEVKGILEHFNIVADKNTGVYSSEKLSVLITGVGMVNTAFYLGKYSHLQYDFIINAGVCGAFDRSLKIGDVVNVISDTLSEMGAEDGDNFIPYPDMLLGGTNTYFPRVENNFPSLSTLPKVKAITQNKVHGNENSIQKTMALFSPDIESMEGAAFFRSCENLGSNYVQVRAISNYVEKRDKSKWNMPLAITHLNSFLIQFITDPSL